MFEQYRVKTADDSISERELTAIVKKSVDRAMSELLNEVSEFLETVEKWLDVYEKRTAEKTSLKSNHDAFLGWLAPDPGRSSTKSIDQQNGTGNPYSNFTGWLGRSA